MDELKPCPFCGHPRSRLFYKKEHCEDEGGRVAVRYRIWRACTKCWAHGGYAITAPLLCDKNPRCDWAGAYRAEADAKWNRRDGECHVD